MDARILLPALIETVRCERIYERLLQVGANGARSLDPSHNLYVLSVKAGNVAMIDTLVRWGAVPHETIKKVCLELLYTLHSADPYGVLDRFDRLGWLENIEIGFVWQDAFWRR